MNKIIITLLLFLGQQMSTTLSAQASILEGNLEQNIFFIDPSKKIVFIDFAEIAHAITNISIEKEGTTVNQYDTYNLSSATLFELDFSKLDDAIYTLLITTENQSIIQQQVVLTKQSLQFVYFELVYEN